MRSWRLSPGYWILRFSVFLSKLLSKLFFFWSDSCHGLSVFLLLPEGNTEPFERCFLCNETQHFKHISSQQSSALSAAWWALPIFVTAHYKSLGSGLIRNLEINHHFFPLMWHRVLTSCVSKPRLILQASCNVLCESMLSGGCTSRGFICSV